MSATCIGYNAKQMVMVRTRLKKRPKDMNKQALQWNPQGRRRVGRLRNTGRREFREIDEEVGNEKESSSYSSYAYEELARLC